MCLLRCSMASWLTSGSIAGKGPIAWLFRGPCEVSGSWRSFRPRKDLICHYYDSDRDLEMSIRGYCVHLSCGVGGVDATFWCN